MNRRTFIKGIFSFAAIAVAPSLPVLAAQTEQARLAAAMQSGLVENEIFYLNGPIIIQGISNLIIRNCHFRFRGVDADESIVKIGKDCSNVTLEYCFFQELDF